MLGRVSSAFTDKVGPIRLLAFQKDDNVGAEPHQRITYWLFFASVAVGQK